jgi:hypothetical protein
LFQVPAVWARAEAGASAKAASRSSSEAIHADAGFEQTPFK